MAEGGSEHHRREGSGRCVRSSGSFKKKGDEGEREIELTSSLSLFVRHSPPQGMLVPSLKVAAWKCRLVVVGFAAGTIEKVSSRSSSDGD